MGCEMTETELHKVLFYCREILQEPKNPITSREMELREMMLQIIDKAYKEISNKLRNR